MKLVARLIMGAAFVAALAFMITMLGLILVRPAHAADRPVTRAYVMRGLGGLLISNGPDVLGGKLRSRGAVVMVGGWSEWPAFVADARRHPRDRIVFIGHSMGAWAAGLAGNAIGGRVKVVGIDPLCTYAAVRKGTDATNFTRGIYLACGSHGLMINARNISLAALGDSHIGIISDPRAQARVVSAALGR